MKENKWVRLLAYITGLVNQELLLQNEYLAAENRILRAHLPSRLRLSDPQRSTLAEIGRRLGRKALAQVVCVAKAGSSVREAVKEIARSSAGSGISTRMIPVCFGQVSQGRACAPRSGIRYLREDLSTVHHQSVPFT